MIRFAAAASAILAVTWAAPLRAEPATPAQAQSIETQIRAWLVSNLGTALRLGDRPVQVTADGERYRVEVPFKVRTDGQSRDVSVTAMTRPAGNGSWAFDTVRLPLPLRLTIDMPQAPKEGQRSPAPPLPVTYDATVASQDANGVWDPTNTVPSTMTQTLAGFRTEATGQGLRQLTVIDRSTSTTTAKPTGADRFDVVSDSVIDGYNLTSKTADAEEVKLSIRRATLGGTLTGVSRENGAKVVQATMQMFGSLMAASEKTGGVKAPVAPAPAPGSRPQAGRPAPAAPAVAPAAASPMDFAPMRAMLVAFRDVASEMALTETAEDMALSYGPYAGRLARASFAMGGKSVDGMLQATMDIGMDGLALPDLQLGPLEALIPKRLALRPMVSGVATKDLLDLLIASIDNKGGPPPDAAIAKLFSHGGLTTGLESFLLEIGGAVFNGSANVLVPNPASFSATGKITAEKFDSLIEAAKAIPQMAQVLPVFVFAKGIGRTVDNRLVWDLSYGGGKVLVNGTDLSSMMGGRP